MKTKTYSPLSWACNLSAFALSFLVIHHAAANSFTSTGSMTVPRAWVDSVLLLNGKVLAVGGYDGVNYQSSAELYDPATGTWTATGALPAPGGPYTTLLPNGKVLVAGGFGSGNVAELYDPATGVWTPTGSMNRSRSAPVTLLPNGKVLVAGGSIGDKTAELLDSATGLWTPTGSMNVGRSEFIACLLPNGKVLAAGGNGNGANLSSAELYDPATGEWTLTGSMNSSRRNGANTMLPNGKFFICGGIGNSGDLAAAELYDPTTGVWTQTGSMSHIRNGHLVTLLPNGDVLVVGGYYKQASAELYSPGTGTWRAAAAPHIGREVHIQKLLPSGAVLVAGGRDAGTSAELYFSQAASTCTPTPSGTVAWWPGEGTAQDIIGTNNSTLMNGATYLQVGKVGQAFSFDGVDDYVSAPQTALSNILNNFTMEFWVYPTASRSVTTEANSGISGAGGQRYAIFPYFSTVSDTGAGVSVGTNGISVFEHGSYYLPSPLVYQGAIFGWTHVAVVYTNKQPLLYVNGVLVRTGLTSARSSVHPSPGLGGYNWYGYYAGLLDEVSIYNRALTADEIASIYAAGSAGKCPVVPPPNCVPAPAGLVAWWPGEYSAQDIIGTNSGTLTNGATYSTGKVGQSFSFDGVDDIISKPRTRLNTISNTFTTEFWVYPTASRAVTVEANSGVTGTCCQRYAIYPEWGINQDAGAGISVGTNGISVFEHAAGYLPSLLVYQGTITGWTHVAVVYANKQPSLYVNGVWVRTGLTSVRSFVFPAAAFGGDGSGYGYFAGLLDEVSIYDRALTASEIASIYSAGSAGKCLVASTLVRNPVIGWPTNGLGMTNMPADLTNAIKIAAGVYHSLALKADGTVIGWGENDFGQTETPVGLTNVTAIAAGWGTSLALRRDGTLAEWGWDGGYGLKSTAESLTNITAISACWDCLMALRSDGTVFVWGKSTHGETNLPSGLTGITAIAGGGFHCLALKSDGTVAAWGDNSEGQLNVPAGLTGVVGIAAGGYHSLALRQDGTVVAWGKNSADQTNVPSNLSEVVAISGGYYHSLALKCDGSIAAWGDNSNGQTNVPASLTNVVAIAAGGYHNLALTGSRAPWTKFKNLSCTTNGQVRFTVAGLCGDVYQILGSTNLQHWQVLATITNVSGAVEFIDPSATNYSQRFYRILMP